MGRRFGQRRGVTSSWRRRMERVAEAKRQGQSLRAIASLEHVCEKQIRLDLTRACAEGYDVAPPASGILGLDGKRRGARPAPEQPAAAAVEAASQAEAPAEWTPPRPMCSLPPPGSPTCLRCNGATELELARRARAKSMPPRDGIPNFPLCQRCWSMGCAACGPCGAAHNPALRDWDGSYTRYGFPKLRPLTEEERSWAWRRCEVCWSPFQGPRYGIPNMCPTCRAGPAICPRCGGRDRAHLRVCPYFIPDTTHVACGQCGNPLASNGLCHLCRENNAAQDGA